ncbi:MULTISPECIES: DUF3619 family protein [Cellvibrio]|jgi:hypothetical protein|uniref:DUF3619 domain-containing protein n=1 Tax=Cellvibrio fibrivorans TaxID=126350 RepID=A0ABU1UV46_9GAMM|nr:DUF3619 family protein [Cellvibrio fibrivorans]MDR7089035.1 hypothetical protein [Cellvibrio fibrivorans]
MKPEDQIPNADEQLAIKIADALDVSLQSLDAEAHASLLQARQQALASKRSISTPLNALAGIAAAASIAAAVVLPGYWNDQSALEFGDEFSYLSVDPQLLEDMEMLQVLGETTEDTSSET